MATLSHHHGLRLFMLSCVLVGVLCKDLAETHHTIEVSSLLPSASCKPSATKGARKTSSLKVAHRHGPCAPGSQNPNSQAPQLTHDDILRADQSRVDSINSRMTSKPPLVTRLDDVRESKTTDIPSKSGRTVGSGNYVVTLGLGAPWKQMTLIFDTGSDLTWTQCKPCVKQCYQQREPMYDSMASASYRNISCTSDACSHLTTTTGIDPDCSASTCVYGIQYGDSSYSVGFLAKDKLRVTTTDTFDSFIFGCGQNNQGHFGQSAGLLGLGRDKLSFVEQSAAKYGRYFSYCLPSSLSSTGHLTFGKGSRGSNVKFTPLATIKEAASFYGINIEGINVGGRVLSISASTFSNAPAIIDSGTVITRLPPTAYAALKNAFKQGMSKYPKAPALSILDTCYDMSAYTTVSIPKVGFSFNGAGNIDLDPSGILYATDASQICLAFASNSDDTDVIIYGNVQQQTFEVVYDIEASRIGFLAKGC
ncbi:aspartyl protease family protein At5g10770-like [Punica granatum]|uniref:Aspartyl protease family protein At5g10770-like n=2 Tax=Punica granatum TaxID=22663 RepID=A0A6P8BRU6_PUNGR|nr:aspartyl protease family protein At5g10770-like [Punica granatum]PKI37127.1 hypothetical protein CRG98_042462 [Punica granatum]